MHVSTSVPVNVRSRRVGRFWVIVAAAAVIALGAWALVSFVADGVSRSTAPAKPLPTITLPTASMESLGGMAGAGGTPSRLSVLGSLSPQNRRYVEAISRLTPAQIAAAFGTAAEPADSALASLTPSDRHYVEAIAALTPQQIAAAFGTGR
jgi:hypothetical protein